MIIENKEIFIIGKGPTQGLENTKMTAEKEYAINFSEQQKKFCISFIKMEQIFSYLLMVLKSINSEINSVCLCLGNNYKKFSADIVKKTGLYEYVYYLSVDYDSTDVADILNIHNYLMVKTNIK